MLKKSSVLLEYSNARGFSEGPLKFVEKNLKSSDRNSWSYKPYHNI